MRSFRTVDFFTRRISAASLSLSNVGGEFLMCAVGNGSPATLLLGSCITLSFASLGSCRSVSPLVRGACDPTPNVVGSERAAAPSADCRLSAEGHMTFIYARMRSAHCGYTSPTNDAEQQRTLLGESIMSTNSCMSREVAPTVYEIGCRAMSATSAESHAACAHCRIGEAR